MRLDHAFGVATANPATLHADLFHEAIFMLFEKHRRLREPHLMDLPTADASARLGRDAIHRWAASPEALLTLGAGATWPQQLTALVPSKLLARKTSASDPKDQQGGNQQGPGDLSRLADRDATSWIGSSEASGGRPQNRIGG